MAAVHDEWGGGWYTIVNGKNERGSLVQNFLPRKRSALPPIGARVPVVRHCMLIFVFVGSNPNFAEREIIVIDLANHFHPSLPHLPDLFITFIRIILVLNDFIINTLISDDDDYSSLPSSSPPSSSCLIFYHFRCSPCTLAPISNTKHCKLPIDLY
jgi:hypothetical protein